MGLQQSTLSVDIRHLRAWLDVIDDDAYDRISIGRDSVEVTESILEGRRYKELTTQNYSYDPDKLNQLDQLRFGKRDEIIKWIIRGIHGIPLGYRKAQ